MRVKQQSGTLSTVVSALRARTQFGRILKEVELDRRSFVVEKRGAPKAIILSVADYVRLAAPEPEILRIVGEESRRKGTDRFSARRIESIIREARREQRATNAAAQARP